MLNEIRVPSRIVMVLCLLGLCASAPLRASEVPPDPPYETDLETLAASVDCTWKNDDPASNDREPVVIVHGTFTNAREQAEMGYKPFLLSRGFDVCMVTYPDRGLNDMQVSAEYVAHAVQHAHRVSGRKVDMVGHSQGALMPRWAIRYWGSVREALDDFVMLAGPQHGTQVAEPSRLGLGSGVMHQFRPDSEFIRALNEGDETPGTISYTSIYTVFDQLVQPQLPGSTSTLRCDEGEEATCSNFYVQDVCPGRLVDHVLIGTAEPAVAEMVVQAFLVPGALQPADISADVCVATGMMESGDPSALPRVLQYSAEQGAPSAPFMDREPPLKAYAQRDEEAVEKEKKKKKEKDKRKDSNKDK